MSLLHRRCLSRATRQLVLIVFAAFLAAPAAHAEIAAVASRTYHGYKRTRLPDKTFEREGYAVVNAGRWDGATAGSSIDDITFEKVIKTLAPPLAQRGYFPEKDPNKIKLMIFVAWGTTSGSEGVSYASGNQRAVGDAMNAVGSAPTPAEGQPLDGAMTAESAVATAQSDALESAVIMLSAENRWRDRINERNADLLGFQADLQRAYVTNFTTAATDLVDELASNRYFVVLKAYDFQLARKDKTRKVLWETRFSIREQGNDFGDSLAAMAQYASRYFGEETGGLVRRTMPDVKVELGTAEVIRYEPGSDSKPTPAK